MTGKSRRRPACRKWTAGALTVFFVMFFAGGALQAGAAGLLTMEASETSLAAEETKETEKEKRVYLDIDSHYKYEGMEQSFSEGYQPVVKDGILHLVIPFITKGNLEGDRLRVSLIFPEGAGSAFLLKNYQKTVEKKRYILKDGRMVCLEKPGETEPPVQMGEREGYLYSLDLPLSGTAVAGQYAVIVQAVGYTERMEQVSLERRIFISLPETDKPDGTGDKNEGNGQEEGTEQDESGTGNEEGGETGEGSREEDSGGQGDSGSLGGGGGPEEELIRQPKILMEAYNLFGKELTAGSEEQLAVTFRNCSGSQPLYNLKATVSAQTEGVQFSGNSFYVAQTAPGEEFVLETGLKVTLDAECGECPVVFEFEYEDKKGNAVSGKEIVLLSIRQPVELECLTGEIPGVLYVLDTLELSLKTCNVSRAPIYNVQVSLSAEGLFPDGEVFLGNLEAGAWGEGTMHIYVGTRTMETIGSDPGGSDGEKYGPVEGTVNFRYEDRDGKIYEETKPFQTEIKKAQIVSFEVEEPKETNSWWISVSAVIFAGLLLGIVLLVLQLQKKNEQLAERRGSE